MDATFDMGSLPSLCEQHKDFKVFIVTSVLLVTQEEIFIAAETHGQTGLKIMMSTTKQTPIC